MLLLPHRCSTRPRFKHQVSQMVDLCDLSILLFLQPENIPSISLQLLLLKVCEMNQGLLLLPRLQVRDPGQEACGRLTFLKESKTAKGPQTAVCNLNITLPAFKKVHYLCCWLSIAPYCPPSWQGWFRNTFNFSLTCSDSLKFQILAVCSAV